MSHNLSNRIAKLEKAAEDRSPRHRFIFSSPRWREMTEQERTGGVAMWNHEKESPDYKSSVAAHVAANPQDAGLDFTVIQRVITDALPRQEAA